MAATAAIGTMAMGTATKAVGGFQEGQDQRKYFNKQAQLADWQALDAEQRGKVEEKKMRRQTNQTIGSERVNAAAQGVDVNSGSALDVQADAAYLGELDALTIRKNAAKEAWGYRVQRDDLKHKGKVAQHKGTFGAFDTILSGASSMLMSSYGK